MNAYEVTLLFLLALVVVRLENVFYFFRHSFELYAVVSVGGSGA